MRGPIVYSAAAGMAFIGHRRFRFSLRTLFVLVTVLGVVGWWGNRHLTVRAAIEDLGSVQARCEAEVGPTEADVCAASLALLHAEIRLPFSDRSHAAQDHLERVRHAKQRVDYLASCGLSGGGTPQMQRLQATVDSYYAEARRLAAK